MPVRHEQGSTRSGPVEPPSERAPGIRLERPTRHDASVLWVGGQRDDEGVEGDATVEHIRTESGALWAVDVLECPRLLELDLRLARPGVRVRVGGCPSLRRIRLPETGGGAELHLDFGFSPPDLELTGAIESVDARGTWRLDETVFRTGGRRRAWMGGRIGARRGFDATSPALVVCVGDGAKPTLSLPADCPVQELVVVDDGALRELKVAKGVPLRHLAVSRAPALESVRLHTIVERVDLAELPRLRLVHIRRTEHLAVQRSAEVEHLQLKGTQRTVHLSYCGAEAVDFGLVSEISVFLCTRLQRVNSTQGTRGTCRLFLSGHRRPEFSSTIHAQMAPLSREHTAEVFAHEDRETQDAYLEWARTARGGVHLVTGLQILLSAARVRPAERDELWRIRCEPVEGARDAARRHQEAWAWSFPDDLGDRGWAADLELWLLCRGGQAAAYREVLARSADPVHLATFAGSAIRNEHAPERRDAVLDLLGEALRHGADRGGPIDAEVLDASGRVKKTAGVAPMDAEGLVRLQVCLVRLARLGEGARCTDLLEGLLAWLERRVSTRYRADALAELWRLGYAPARDRLRDLAASALDDALRREALRRLTTPPRALSEQVFAALTPEVSP